MLFISSTYFRYLCKRSKDTTIFVGPATRLILLALHFPCGSLPELSPRHFFESGSICAWSWLRRLHQALIGKSVCVASSYLAEMIVCADAAGKVHVVVLVALLINIARLEVCLQVGRRWGCSSQHHGLFFYESESLSFRHRLHELQNRLLRIDLLVGSFIFRGGCKARR